MIAEKEQNTTPVEKESPKKRRTQPVLIYLIILTVVVVGMLILSYAMQRRNTQHLEDLNKTVTGIQSSYDSMVTINDLHAQIDTMTAQISQYEDQIEDLQEQLEQAKSDADAAGDAASANEQKLNDTLGALEYLILLEQYYQEEDYQTCAAIISTMESAGYNQALSNDSWSTNVAEGKSAAERYTEIKQAVQANPPAATE